MSIQHRKPTTIREYNHAVDAGAYLVFGGRLRMWRLVKRLSQLVVIGFGFWTGVQGTISPTIAFGGMILVYLGVEGFESFLAIVGSEGLSVTVESDDGDDDDTEQTRWETDGGRTMETYDDAR